MPIYEFRCETCGHIDEHLMKINDPSPEKCSICASKVHKIMSMSSFSLKGTGWYATDYKNSAQKSPVETTENKSTETTTETKTPETLKSPQANSDTVSNSIPSPSQSATTVTAEK